MINQKINKLMNWIFIDFLSHDLIEWEFQFSNVVFLYQLLSYRFCQHQGIINWLYLCYSYIKRFQVFHLIKKSSALKLGILLWKNLWILWRLRSWCKDKSNLKCQQQIIHGKRTEVSQWKTRSSGQVFCPECGNKCFGKTKVKGHMEAVCVGENQSTWIVKTISGVWK